jgi:hypothetical protein
MSADPGQRVTSQAIEQERRRLGQRLDEVARMCEANLPPGVFYGELLKRLLESLAAPAGIVWARTPQGNLQQQFQINAREIGLDKSEDAKACHEELLRLAVTQAQPMHLPPHSSVGPSEPGKPAAGNPTDHLLLIVPVLQNNQLTGLLEVWQGANRPPNAVPGFLEYMRLMADLAARYQRNQIISQLSGQQQLWAQLEAFTRQIHSSLKVTEVAYLVANEGRRLIECDRVSVAVRRGRRTSIEAVSGADVVERRSNLVRLMRKLSNHVLDWGEKLVFAGQRDDSLPPKVLEALDEYLAESPSHLLVVLPLRPPLAPEDRDKGKEPKPPRSALIMECFEAPPDASQQTARLDVIGQHAVSALGNALDHQRIPMRFVWEPIAKLQEGLGGKAMAITTTVLVALTVLISCLIFLPYPLKMEAAGNLQPAVRTHVYPEEVGQVVGFDIKPGAVVGEHQVLARMKGPELQARLNQLLAERNAAKRRMDEYRRVAQSDAPVLDRVNADVESKLQQEILENKDGEIQRTKDRTRALLGANGRFSDHFSLVSPRFTPEESLRLRSKRWTVLKGDFRENWVGKQARPSDAILSLGALDGPWEIELKIPQKHIGQVLRAYEKLKPPNDELDVDFIVKSDPTKKWKGKLARSRIAGEATPNRDDKDEAEPVVLAFVRIDGSDIDKDYRLPPVLRLAGADTRVKIRCGSERMGYSLFYGVWEFLHEKVVFFF